MARTGSAHEVQSDTTRPRYPGLLQEVFQWKPKPKGKKQKSQIDDTRTEISYSASTAAGEADFETSTYVSKDLGTTSSRSVDSKRSKKRGKKQLKEPSGSVYSEAASSSPTAPEQSTNKDATSEPSYFVTLNCPLCEDPDCILNKASHCPLLRHKDSQFTSKSVTKDTQCSQCTLAPDASKDTQCTQCTVVPDVPNDDCCAFCGTNCRCEENKKKFLPVSGLVQRDENGIAVTLLKANGGPIENSYEWANRRHWDVPSYVRWEHKISEWITAPSQEHMKAGEPGHKKKLHKLKNKRKSRNTPSALTATPEMASNSEEHHIEDEDPETKLILDGNGFKIFSKGNEKILINYDRKNCKYMGCKCQPTADSTNCGCGDQQTAKEKTMKHLKNCPNRPGKISLLKETSHGLEHIQRELEANNSKENTKACDGADKIESNDKCDESSKQKLKKANPDNKQEKDSNKKCELTGKDFRNQSRTEFLEKSLRQMLGDDYRNFKEAEKDGPENLQMDDYIGIPCPEFDQTGAFMGGSLGTCTCAQNCCYSTYL